jgi:hypothetical protein
MALKLPKLPSNLLSRNNMTNVLYFITLALSISYIMNRQHLALVCLLVVAGGVYMYNKKIMYALGISIVVTNLLLSMNYFKQFEGFKEGRVGRDDIRVDADTAQRFGRGNEAQANVESDNGIVDELDGQTSAETNIRSNSQIRPAAHRRNRASSSCTSDANCINPAKCLHGVCH